MHCAFFQSNSNVQYCTGSSGYQLLSSMGAAGTTTVLADKAFINGWGSLDGQL
jgi:hypothetical protein